MERIANVLPTFEGDIGEYKSFYEKVVNDFQEMVAHMDELHTMWEGEAHEEFQQTFKIDQAKVEQMIDDFKKVLEELGYAHAAYQKNENQIDQLIADLDV